MSVTVYSALMAVLWCNVFIAVTALLRRRNGFLLHFSIVPLLFLVFLGIFRLLCSIELPSVYVLQSWVIFPAILDFFTKPLFAISGGTITVSLSGALVIVWAAGGVVLLLKLMHQVVQLNKTLGRIPGTRDPRLLSLTREIVAESGKHTAVKLIKSPEITTPMITGFFKPTIFLPDLPLADDELKNILRHEWTHFLHKDAWVKLVMCAVRCAFWWNPFIHLLRGDLDHVLELQCDLSLTSHMDEENRVRYLRSIKKIVERVRSRKTILAPHAAGFVSTKNEGKLEQRFHLVLDYQPKNRQGKHRVPLACVLILLSFVISYAFVIQPAGAPTDEPRFENFYTISPDNAYLTRNEDGTYSLYADGQYRGGVERIDIEPYDTLPIK